VRVPYRITVYDLFLIVELVAELETLYHALYY
jgi:hypothetical protein